MSFAVEGGLSEAVTRDRFSDPAGETEVSVQGSPPALPATHHTCQGRWEPRGAWDGSTRPPSLGRLDFSQLQKGLYI